MKLRGIYMAAVTPLRHDNSIDVDYLAAHCRWGVENGAHGVSLFGTTGEGNSFSVAERRDALDEVVALGVDPAAILPGAGACALDDTADTILQAVSLGCPAVLVMPPFYYKDVTDDGVFRSYADTIEKVGDPRLKVLLYNIPQLTHIAITPSLLERLATAYPDTLVGVKDSAGSWEDTLVLLRNFPDLSIFTGLDSHLQDLLMNGGAGLIGGMANINPMDERAIFDAYNRPETKAITASASRLLDIVDSGPGIQGLKYLLAHFRHDPAWRRVRPPLQPLEETASTCLVEAFEAAGYRYPDVPKVA